MPANSRWDLIRRLRVNRYKFKYRTSLVLLTQTLWLSWDVVADAGSLCDIYIYVVIREKIKQMLYEYILTARENIIVVLQPFLNTLFIRTRNFKFSSVL